MLIHDRANFDHCIDELLRHEQIAQAQRGEENFTHRPSINDPTRVIEALQTRKRGTGEAKLGTVIILEKEGIARAREFDQSRAARETHCHAQWKLVRWRDEDELRRPLF